MKKRPAGPSPLVQNALRGIVLSVLAMPLAAVQACSRTSTATSKADASDTGARVDATAAAAPPGPCTPIELDASAYDRSGSGCARYVRLPCGLPPETALRGCLPELKTCVSWCESSFRCQLAPDVTCRKDGSLVADAAVIVECVQCASGAGRRPRGLSPARRVRARSPMGAYFAELAHLEAASVAAFRDLGRALTRVGAPPALTHSASRAVADEQRHARTTRRLALRFGGSPRRPHVVRTPEPSLEELLLDNAEEGCVGESYGAVVAMWQAERAGDRMIARAMRIIAHDEAQHASLAWALLRWGAPRLDARGQQRVRRRLVASVAKLHEQAERPIDPSIVELAGHPSREVARALVERFERFVLDETSRAFG